MSRQHDGAFVRPISTLLRAEAPANEAAGAARGLTGEGKKDGMLVFNVLLIDDEPEAGLLLGSLLEDLPARVVHALTGEQGLKLSRSEGLDLIVLDLGLPGLSGLEVCRRLKQNPATAAIPVLVMTADDSERSETGALAAHADDWVAKGISIPRRVARIRRLLWTRFPLKDGRVMDCGSVSLDTKDCRLSVKGHQVGLTPQETGILAVLMSRAGKLIDGRALYRRTHKKAHWRAAKTTPVKTHIRNIRRKLNSFHDLIQSQRDQGYRFNVELAARLNFR